MESLKVERKKPFTFLLIFFFKTNFFNLETPFTLTSQMTHVLGDHFGEFEEAATRAFIEVRREKDFFVGQIMGALGGRLPHVKKLSDARVVWDSLLPTLEEFEAERIFRELIHVALDSKQTQINDALHTFYMQNFYKAPVEK